MRIEVLNELAHFVRDARSEFLTESARPTTEAEIDRFEALAGFPLPRAVREYWGLMGERGGDRLWDDGVNASFSRATKLLEDERRHDATRDAQDERPPFLTLGDDEISSVFYTLFPVDVDDPPLHRTEGNPEGWVLAERFSWALNARVFTLLAVGTCSIRLAAMTARPMTRERFDEVVTALRARGYVDALPTSGIEPCLRRDAVRLTLQLHWNRRVSVICGGATTREVEQAASEFARIGLEVARAR